MHQLSYRSVPELCAWKMEYSKKQLYVNLAGTSQAETSDRVNVPTFNHRRLVLNKLAQLK